MWRLSVLQLMFNSNKFNEKSRQPPNDQINDILRLICMFWENVIIAALENEKHRQWLTIIMAKNLLKSIFMVEKCKIR